MEREDILIVKDDQFAGDALIVLHIIPERRKREYRQIQAATTVLSSCGCCSYDVR